MELTYRNVISGLEGCGKSSQLFNEIKDVATTDEPVLFGVKNYRLMQEQILNWSSRFNIPVNQFAICGFNESYEPAKEAYTNKEMPYLINKGAKYVFTSQAVIQRNRHLRFRKHDGSFVRFKHIVIDEFDFTSGIIPSLDYELSNMRDDDIKKRTIQDKLDWILKNYTFEDRLTANIKRKQHNTSFSIAYWIDNSTCPITFLTSELLATRLLKLLGFNEINIPSPEFKDCVVNTWSSELIGRSFFNKMNQYVGWDKLNYDLIISDCINSYFEENNLSLDITVITHTSIRGSNDWINKKVLTILSHIPQQVLITVKDAFTCFGESIEYTEVESLFYRDRLCQAIGRVLGNRGSKQTDLLVHNNIINKIQELDNINNIVPYTINLNWEFTFNGFNKILDKVKEVELLRKEQRTKKYVSTKVKSYKQLEAYFIKDNDSVIPISQVKDYLINNQITGANGRGTLSVTKIAEYFGCRIKTMRAGTDKKPTRCIVGLAFLY